MKFPGTLQRAFRHSAICSAVEPGNPAPNIPARTYVAHWTSRTNPFRNSAGNFPRAERTHDYAAPRKPLQINGNRPKPTPTTNHRVQPRNLSSVAPRAPSFRPKSLNPPPRHSYASSQSPVSCWPSRDPIEERGGVNLYAYVHNKVPNWVERLGLSACKQVSFEWTTKPAPFGYELEFESLGDGLMNGKRLTIFWKGEAKIKCCCMRNNMRYDVTQAGTLIGSYEADVGSDEIYITGGNAMPMSVSTATSIGEAIADVAERLISGLGDLPASLPSEMKDAKIALRNALEDWKNEAPDNFTWKDGWPCKDL